MTRLTSALVVAGMLIFAVRASGQTYADDSLIVRAILDSNGLDSLPVTACTAEGADCRPNSPCTRRIAELKIRGMGMMTLPAWIGGLDALMSLHIDGNNLTDLPREIGQLPILSSLWVQNNELTTLPKELAQCTALSELIIDQNPFRSLPEEVGRMGVVKSLRINNKLSAFPSGLGSFTSLEGLELDNNNIASLPAEIGRLVNLRTLTAQQCGLSAISDSITRLPAIEAIDLSDNKITSLPLFENSPHLKSLSFRNNELYECENLIVLDSLTALDISGNNLTGLPVRIGMLGALQTLRAADNRLMSLSSISQLRSLKTLDLSNNCLVTLPDSFGNLTSLVELRLDSNALKSLPPGIVGITGIVPRIDSLSSVYPASSVDHLDIGGNRLCSLDAPLVAWADAYDRDWRSTQVCLSSSSEVIAWEASGKDFFSAYTNPDDRTITAVFTASSGAVFAGNASGRVFRSADGGSSWRDISDGIYAQEVNRVSCFAQDSAGNIYAGTRGTAQHRGSVFLLHDNSLWSSIGPLESVTALAVTSMNELFAGTWGGIYMRKADGTWDSATTDLDSVMPACPEVLCFGAEPDGRLTAVVSYPCQNMCCGTYLLRRTGGDTWTHDTTVKIPSFLPSASSSNNDETYASVANAILKYAGGRCDTISTSTMVTPVNAVAVDPHNRLFTLNDGGLAYVRSDTGWTPFDWDLPAAGAAALAFDTAGNIFAATNEGVYVNRSFAHAKSAVHTAAPRPADRCVPAVAFRHAGLELLVGAPANIAVTIVNGQGRIVRQFPMRRYAQGVHRLDANRGAFAPGSYVCEIVNQGSEDGAAGVHRTRLTTVR